MRRLRAGLFSAAAGMLTAGCLSTPPLPVGSPGGPVITADVLVADDGARLPLYRHQPSGEARALVLGLHSFGDFGAAFDRLGAKLKEHGIATLAIDQRGFGANPDLGVWSGDQRMVDDLNDFIQATRQEFGRVPLFLIGESMGGAVVLAAAAQGLASTEGIILVAPGVREDVRLRWLGDLVYGTAATLAPGWTVRIDPNVDALRPDARTRIGSDLRALDVVRADTYDGLINLSDRASDQAGKVNLPTLLLYGEADGYVQQRSIDALVRRLPRPPDLVLYPTGIHRLLHQEVVGDQVEGEIIDWIEQRIDPNR